VCGSTEYADTGAIGEASMIDTRFMQIQTLIQHIYDQLDNLAAYGEGMQDPVITSKVDDIKDAFTDMATRCGHARTPASAEREQGG
jgi:hypothetical protein